MRTIRGAIIEFMTDRGWAGIRTIIDGLQDEFSETEIRNAVQELWSEGFLEQEVGQTYALIKGKVEG